MCWESSPPERGERAVGKESEAPALEQAAVERLDGARREIAGIGEGFQPGLAPPLVDGLEFRPLDVRLAAHHKPAAQPFDTLRDRPDEPHVPGHIVPDEAVAAGHTGNQAAVLVNELERDPVNLRLAAVRDPLPRKLVPHPAVEVEKILLVVRVRDAQHGFRVGALSELAGEIGPHPHGGARGSGVFWIHELKRLQLLHEDVVLLVGDDGARLLVVQPVVLGDLAPQRLYAVLRIHARPFLFTYSRTWLKNPMASGVR